jgi:hypothetical protein
LEIRRLPATARQARQKERSMDIRRHINLPLLAMLGAAIVADAQVQPQLAKRYFEQVSKLCERDAGRLWGCIALWSACDL